MKKVAFKMQLFPGCVEEYRKRHEQLWPELRKIMKDAGISDYSIFLDEETLTLFAVQKIHGQGNSQDLGKNEVVKKWWEHMSDIMETNPDHSPVSVPLLQVFHMD